MPTGMMRAVAWAGPDRLERLRLPVPELEPGRLLVRTERVGICGSDLAILRGEHARARPGIVLGHEFTGIVAASRADGGPAIGERVAVRPLISCADRGADLCRPCAAGAPHVCASLGLYGVDEPGGLAEYVSVRADAAHPVAASVPPELAALAEPLAVAVHAVARSGLSGGDTAVVYGAGPIGLFTALVARHRGAGTVLVAEPNAWRREVVADYGLPVLESDVDTAERVRERTGGGADVVFDSAGHPAVARQLTAAARIRGTIVIAGVYSSPPELDLRALNFAEQHVLGTRVYSRADFATAVELLGSDALGLSRLPRGEHALADSEAAFAAAAAGQGGVKVLIAPDDAGSENA